MSLPAHGVHMNEQLPHGIIVHTTDSLGNALDVEIGIVHDNNGDRRLSLRIGDGPTAMLVHDDGTGPNLLPALRRVYAKLIRTGPS